MDGGQPTACAGWGSTDPGKIYFRIIFELHKTGEIQKAILTMNQLFHKKDFKPFQEIPIAIIISKRGNR